MNNQDIETIQVPMEQVQAEIKLGELLEELHKNRAFKKLILEDYFKVEAENLVAVLGSPMSDMQRTSIINKMTGISMLRAHFNGVMRKADSARLALLEHNEVLAERMAAEQGA